MATRRESEEPPQRDGHPWYLTKQALKKAGITTGPLLAGRADTGKFTKKIDAALHLGKAARLYQQLDSVGAAILAQLRTGKSCLNDYLHKINASETAACGCGQAETIPHFLFACRRWVQCRARLRQQHGDRFGDISYALGGYSSRQEGGENIDGPMGKWKPDISVVRTTIQFAKETGRLQPKEQNTTTAEADLNERRLLLGPSPTS
jgi:hypothetical protein